MTAQRDRDGAPVRWTFAALVLAQALHSLEEVVFRLWDVFAPARFLSQLVAPDDPALGFALINVAIVALGVWCVAARVWPGHPAAGFWMWVFIAVEVGNAITHPAVALARGGYFPGVATAPLLLALAIALGFQLRARPQPA